MSCHRHERPAVLRYVPPPWLPPPAPKARAVRDLNAAMGEARARLEVTGAQVGALRISGEGVSASSRFVEPELGCRKAVVVPLQDIRDHVQRGRDKGGDAHSHGQLGPVRCTMVHRRKESGNLVLACEGLMPGKAKPWHDSEDEQHDHVDRA